jgi:hypothetical protein
VQLPRFAALAAGVLTVPVLLVAAVPAVSSAAVLTRFPDQGTVFAAKGLLAGVAATSARNAWAVGYTGTARHKILILHWNGASWKQALGPAAVARGNLSGVATATARSAWAVGSTRGIRSGGRSLILHWNGKSWRRVPSPAPGTGSSLSGVAIVSPTNAWAVGTYVTSIDPFGMALVLHWNGVAWKRVPLIAIGLSGVAVASRRSVWAVAGGGDGLSMTVAERWNGHAWLRVPSPNPGGWGFLLGVAVVSARSAWAVGYGAGGKAVILRWNGTAWNHVPSPAAASSAILSAVATSARGAWAVGCSRCPTSDISGGQILIMHWNGRAWKLVPGPAGGSRGNLSGVSATSARNAWAVGQTSGGKILILRWNGASWR